LTFLATQSKFSVSRTLLQGLPEKPAEKCGQRVLRAGAGLSHFLLKTDKIRLLPFHGNWAAKVFFKL
jgi:hypothetical protein